MSLHQRTKLPLLVYNAWLSGYLYRRRYFDCLVNKSSVRWVEIFMAGETPDTEHSMGGRDEGEVIHSLIPLQQLQVALPIRFSSYNKLVFIWVEKCKQWAPWEWSWGCLFFFLPEMNWRRGHWEKLGPWGSTPGPGSLAGLTLAVYLVPWQPLMNHSFIHWELSIT